MKPIVLVLGSSLLSTTAFAQAVDCSNFQRQKDGSWVVAKSTRLAAVENGVSKSIGLAPGLRFARDHNHSMGGVDVFQQVETACR